MIVQGPSVNIHKSLDGSQISPFDSTVREGPTFDVRELTSASTQCADSLKRRPAWRLFSTYSASGAIESMVKVTMVSKLFLQTSKIKAYSCMTQ